eukprot:g51667.t1
MTLCPIKIRHWKEIWHIWMRSTTLKAPLQSSREISCRYDLNTLKLALKPPQKSDLRREERHVTHRPPNATKKANFFQRFVVEPVENSLAITAKALRNFSKSKMFSKMPVTEPWGKEKKTSFQTVKESMPVIKYDELDPQPAKLDIAGLIFSHHKGIPGMYQFRRQMDRNIAKALGTLNTTAILKC